MEAKILKIKCPNCSAVITVKVKANAANAIIPCPVCKQRTPLSSYKVVDSPDAMDKTRGVASSQGEGKTQLNVPMSSGVQAEPGHLTIISGGSDVLHLKDGRNIVGRGCQSSSADIRLPSTCGHVSREHLVIHVRRVMGDEGVCYKHVVSLYKESVNTTYINSTKLVYGDSLILNDGDVIKFPDLALRFNM